MSARDSHGIDISLAQWSLNQALSTGVLNHLDFPAYAKNTCGIEAVEYVNSYFKDKAKDKAYLDEMNTRCADLGVFQNLIMIDGEGNLGDPDDAARMRAIDNHKKWVDAAVHLGCRCIRVNARSSGTWDAQSQLAADGLRRLAEFAAPMNIHIIVENHGGLSSNGNWMRETIERADHQYVGTLPDFGNFQVGENPYGANWFDRYLGVERMMRFAQAVSAKSHKFDDKGNETGTDYERMLRVVVRSGYRGYLGIEYEGDRSMEREGILKTKALIERVLAGM
ncbi:MAG: sugar phosphate isomerase/epimerase [Phycisphaeraceae bacterium]|nr:sugar phosphate isomerase/epimerase [Phycisphaerales bacterium]MCB9860659.1 sugar phosphate isomerase/epimerase [Phycisphaeraceae bacterium]